MPSFCRVMLFGLLILLTVMAHLLPAMADTVRLHNSWKRYTGHLVRIDDQQVQFVTDQGLSYTWPRSSVADIHIDTNNGVGPAPSASLNDPLAPHRLPPPPGNHGNPSRGIVPVNTFSSLAQFPGADGQTDSDQFTWLARFRGKNTQTVYAGLYRFPDRGTFWLNLGHPVNQPKRLSFMLYGKWTAKSMSESFSISARFLDAYGQLVGEAPIIQFQPEPNQLTEWFEYLDNMSGVGRSQPVQWLVPARTQTVELFVPNAQGPNALVGYLSHMTLE